MIVVTGAAGFIGSCLISHLNQNGSQDILAVDDFTSERKSLNLFGKQIRMKVDREVFISSLEKYTFNCVIHLGARTDTTETNGELLKSLNTDYSKRLWSHCVRLQIPFLYASSAATYGSGNKGFSDNHEILNELEPLNGYAKSKHEFDKWVLNQSSAPPYWVGLKFFNVYGPNEYHKGHMASVVLHAYRQIKETGKLKLFKSHHHDFAHGEQLRDFIYVKDVIKTLSSLIYHPVTNGIYNLGTAKAKSFNELAQAIFSSMGQIEQIEYIDMPKKLRENYQYFTQADTQKIKSTGCTLDFDSIEQGVDDYLSNYLIPNRYF